jgi:hypothetical protein
MIRRDFLALMPGAALAQRARKKEQKDARSQEPPPPPPPGERVRQLFLDIVRGYLKAARQTSPTLAVVEYPGAAVTKSFLAKSGLSVTGVTRMLPALAAWAASGREPGLGAREALIAAFRNGCDPDSPDYWLPSPPDRQNQRQVEASIVAWSLWVARDIVLPELQPRERSNVAEWLAGCCRVPVRNNNWAWFTAVTQAVLLRLSQQHREFAGDETWMLEDLKALDAMAAGDSGWYNDGLAGAAFDYYNSWVFASHFLYWNAICGRNYPEWQQRFSARLAQYLEIAPYFFANHGGHVLYGRSLIYRWAVLTPLVLAYQQGLWPHPPGLLRRIVERNILWQADLGAFDAAAGKLRETYTRAGSRDICEPYIDGGHPYWGMQAFAFWLIPDGDPFWTAPEEPLPVEKSDFAIAIPEAGLLVRGARVSGQVTLYNAKSTKTELHYRDKYNKLAYHSHFPFAVNHQPGRPTIDNTLVLRDPATGERACRGPVEDYSVEAEKVELVYSIRLGGVTARVQTLIRWRGDFEMRTHLVSASGEGLERLEIVEGGVAYSDRPADLNLGAMQAFFPEVHLKTWNLRGWKATRTEEGEGSVWYGAHKVQTVWAPLAPKMTLASLRYASAKAVPKERVEEEAQRFLALYRP